ncbi:hypothetical protein ACFOG5_06205 [Pedobacter fastidiosus]|uniref:Uncharacterized protein n=1 Tax=Pedobacter fastidiosus TaxID=2765361 RepID=A0ABR7KYR7_9SPHI|nr:hypothetical protein [Pedobacter fastidiosus]MBC6112897.1 hypothetical protein [Pedobacter fastidiosus]
MIKTNFKALLLGAFLIGLSSSVQAQTIDKKTSVTQPSSVCGGCGKAYCDKNCSSNFKNTMADTNNLKGKKSPAILTTKKRKKWKC